MKLTLSTSNILGAGASINRSTKSKSNTELVSSLRANLEASSQAFSPPPPTNGTNGQSNGVAAPHTVHAPDYQTWTKQMGSTLEIPALDVAASALQENRSEYDITLKLFFLPLASSESSARAVQTREALRLVLEELHMPSIDLLIVSFPGIYFDEEEDCPTKLSTREKDADTEAESLESLLATWSDLCSLVDEGLVQKLGVAEFGRDRLANFLDKLDGKHKPSVDQINLRDCCSVPKDLMALAKSKSIELLVHNDCSNILPRGTLRDLLGPQGAGVLAEGAKTGDKRKSLHGEDGIKGTVEGGRLRGEVQPLWVVKYTAVVRLRGVVECKGYFAGAEVIE